jgi:hypothetical protein
VVPIEDLLREEFQRADAPEPPERDTMLARVTTVRRRRVAATVGGSGLALAAVAVTGAALLPGPAGWQAGSDDPPRDYSNELINTVFVDQQHGYVVQQRCSMDRISGVPEGAPTPYIHQQCTTQLLATADAGHTWQERTIPGDPATKDAGVDLMPGHSLMLWVDGPGILAFGGWNRQYWTTNDGGSVWQEATAQRDLGPAGSFGTFGVNDRPVFLASRPPVDVGEKNPVVPATDGSFWVACTDGACAHVTRDQGATWPTVPIGDGAAAVDWLATYDGHTVYAQIRNGSAARLVRSTDSGATWTDTLALTAPGAAALVLPTGDVLLTPANADGGLYRFTPGATSLKKVDGAPAHPGVLYLSSGVIVAAQIWDQRETPDVASVVSVSADGGTTWTAIPAPPA